jgi:transposase
VCCGGQEGEADFEARCDVATAHSTFEWMSSHGQLFDEHVSKHSRNQAMGLPRDAGTQNTKVRAGQVWSCLYYYSIGCLLYQAAGV